MSPKRKNNLWILTAILLLTGCTAGFMPVPGNGIMVEDRHGVLRTQNILFAAAHDYWNGEPDNLNEYFSTFRVTVRNTSDTKIVVSQSDIVLIDEAGNQADSVSPERVEDLLISDDPWTETLMLTHAAREELLNKQMTARRNLMQKSFSFGEILPGASKTGYVFFTRLHHRTRAFELRFKDASIPFRIVE